MKSQNKNDQAHRTLLVSEHYKFMKGYVDQIRTTAVLIGSLRTSANEKGLETVESHMQDAMYSLLAAYATINQVFTGLEPQLKEK